MFSYHYLISLLPLLNPLSVGHAIGDYSGTKSKTDDHLSPDEIRDRELRFQQFLGRQQQSALRNAQHLKTVRHNILFTLSFISLIMSSSSSRTPSHPSSCPLSRPLSCPLLCSARTQTTGGAFKAVTFHHRLLLFAASVMCCASSPLKLLFCCPFFILLKIRFPFPSLCGPHPRRFQVVSLSHP